MHIKTCALLISICLYGFPAYATETLTVAVASSLYPVMQQKARMFEKDHHVRIHLVSGSTGRLYNQIVQGAPFDVFIAADKQRPAMLAEQGKALDRQQAGRGYLGVMIGKHMAGLSALASPSVRHIAIANPEVAPFGKVARAVLKKQGLWHVIQHKFVYAQNAMQAAMMVDKGLVDAGFVALASQQGAIANIDYQVVLLADKPLARIWLANIAKPQKIQLARQQR
ncbi:MAG: molybdate ABC transporter substrate-binding protein [Mariprofundus sp.]|nr:molybdate ABC transporter substrate-binding protein [Mariprofundus sp.]